MSFTSTSVAELAKALRTSPQDFSADALADLLASIPIWDEANLRPHVRLVTALAQRINNEESQRLYHFITRVTKLVGPVLPTKEYRRND